MPRDLRYVPLDAMVEVSNRTLEGRLFLRPDSACREVVAGVVAWASDKHAMPLVGQIWLSSHFHLLTLPEDAEHLADYMRDLGANVAKEVNRLRGRRGPFWHDRYHAIVVSDEEEAQVARLAYLLANGVKEGLVAHPRDWPGVSAACHLIDGTALEGTWFDRTTERKLRRRARCPDRAEYTEKYQVEHVPLPCWRHLAPGEYRRRVEELCDQIASEARARHRRPLGVRKLRRQPPLSRPRFFVRDPRPRFHAASGNHRRLLEAQYRDFVSRYRDAAEARLAGREQPPFPPGSYPPRPPFHRARAGPTPHPP